MGRLLNRARMTVTAAAGTAALSLGVASNGQTFGAAGIRDGDVVSYVIEDSGGAWELGQGTYVASGPTLQRTAVRASSASNAAINATTAAIVSLVPLQEDLFDTSVRQTVMSGPRDANGAPTFLPATTPGLSITTQNLGTGTAALIASAANGFGPNGNADLVGVATGALTWGSLPPSTAAVFLPIGVDALGNLTAQAVQTPVPIYQYAGTPSPAAGQYTFNIGEMQMYLGNGSTAPKVNHVIVGEVVTNSSGVTASIAYAYQGFYDSGPTSGLPGLALNVKSHSLGIKPQNVGLQLECTTADNGYAVGDVIQNPISMTNGYPYPNYVVSTTRLAARLTSVGAWYCINESTSGGVALTAASWAWRMIVRRGWGGV